MQKESFKKQYSKEQRLKESENILKHYQDRVPIIIEKDKNSRLPDLDVQKYLFLSNFRVFQLNTLIRSKLNLNKAEAVYLFVNSKVALRGDMSIKEVYDKYQDDDKFLYIQYCEYNTFGV
ncbi:unnamed protein product [Paramecium octaurelia]|uniref:Autophagy-related protein n=1 Tax=Paramecium octaurelia TaxID=43137 RepID=A0A8S1VSB4_PAROT|nr:unnamed protein product [Paramecium octaurelia]